MGGFKKIFARKPGGTAVGNVLRGAVNKATGGILGTGALMITQADADKRDLSDEAFKAKYGTDKAGLPSGKSPEEIVSEDIVGPGMTGIAAKSKGDKIMDSLKKGGTKTIAYLVGGVLGIVGLIMLLVKLVRRRSNKTKQKGSR